MKCPNCDLDHTLAWARTHSHRMCGMVAVTQGAWMLCSCGERFLLHGTPFPRAADPQGRWEAKHD
jgi:hypothetical protein